MGLDNLFKTDIATEVIKDDLYSLYEAFLMHILGFDRGEVLARLKGKPPANNIDLEE